MSESKYFDFPVLMPSVDGFGLIDTVNSAWVIGAGVAERLGKMPHIGVFTSSKGGPGEARRQLVGIAGRAVRREVFRGLFLDTDVIVVDPKEAIDAILYAEEHQINITAPYAGRQPNAEQEKRSSVALKDGVGGSYNLSLAEAQRRMISEPYYEVFTCGLGFYWGELDTRYLWPVYDNPGEFPVEDGLFCRNLDIRPKVAPIHLKHFYRVPM